MLYKRMETGNIITHRFKSPRLTWLLSGLELNTYVCNGQTWRESCLLFMASGRRWSFAHARTQGNQCRPHQLVLEREAVNYSLKRKCLNVWRYECSCRYIDGLHWEWCRSLGEYPLKYIIDQEVLWQSKDESMNSQGKTLLDLCISARMRIVNGRTTGVSAGEYTQRM